MAPAESDNVTVFVDTNCFIQLRDLKDLPWKELFPGGGTIVIVVASVVMDELDTKKHDRNQRVRNRARLALNLINEASRTDGMELSLKPGAKPELLLRLSDIGRLDWDSLPRLDPTRPDDQLVAEAMQSAGGSRAVLLSHDTGPRIRARRCGLEALEVPEDWLLPDDPDEDTREIARLKRENETLRNRYPRIEAAWLNGPEAAEQILVERLKLRPLTEPEIRELTGAYLEAHPREAGVFYPSLGFAIGSESGFTQHDFERYSAEYDKFSEKLPHFFEKLHSLVEQASPMTPVDFRIVNSGSATAEGLTVDFHVTDDWLIFGDEDDADRFYGTRAIAPKPPLTPRLKKVREADEMARGLFRPDFRPRPRDPTGFYWEHRPSAIDHRGSLRCEEFRAKDVYEQTVWIYPWGEDRQSSVLELEVHASNLSDPVPAKVQLTFVETEVDWSDPRVSNRIEDAIRPLIIERFGVGTVVAQAR